MVEVVVVSVREFFMTCFLSANGLDIKKGDKVIVETARGVEFGNVVTAPKDVPDEEIMQPLKSVIRVATEEDKRNEEKNREREKEAFDICLEKIRKHGLDMKLISAEYTFDNNKVLFYFTADEKTKAQIDFLCIQNCLQRIRDVFYCDIPLKEKRELINLISMLINKKYGDWQNNPLYKPYKKKRKLFRVTMDIVENFMLDDRLSSLEVPELEQEIQKVLTKKNR